MDSVTGEHDKSIADIGQADIQVNEIIVHENFNRRNLQNDICILKTDHMRLYARMGMVDRACLPDKDSDHPPPGTEPNGLAKRYGGLGLRRDTIEVACVTRYELGDPFISR